MRQVEFVGWFISKVAEQSQLLTDYAKTKDMRPSNETNKNWNPAVI